MKTILENLNITQEEWDELYFDGIKKANALYRTMEEIPTMPKISNGGFDALFGDEKLQAMVTIEHFASMFRVIELFKKGDIEDANSMYELIIKFIEEEDPSPSSMDYS